MCFVVQVCVFGCVCDCVWLCVIARVVVFDYVALSVVVCGCVCDCVWSGLVVPVWCSMVFCGCV